MTKKKERNTIDERMRLHYSKEGKEVRERAKVSAFYHEEMKS